MITNGTDRQVAYCRRVDSAPKVNLEDGVTWFLLGATVSADSLPAVSCSDSEDGATVKDPTDDLDTAVDSSKAGNYIATCL